MKDRRRCFSAISVGILISAGLAVGASIPAWLDDAITKWTQDNPSLPIEFLDIKDSFVWYTLPRTAEIGHAEIRERIYAISESHGYKRTDAEELVTTAKPPSPTSPHKAKKCWSRSFTLDIAVGRQRMLNTLVCEDIDNWLAGFRILQ